LGQCPNFITTPYYCPDIHQIYEKFSNLHHGGSLGFKVLQLLSQGNTPESARTEAIEKAENGAKIDARLQRNFQNPNMGGLWVPEDTTLLLCPAPGHTELLCCYVAGFAGVLLWKIFHNV
jgi:hypothetical protein